MSGLRLTGLILAAMTLPGTAVIAASQPQQDSAARAVKPHLVGGREVTIGASRVLFLWGTGATILWSEDGYEWQPARTRGSADLAQLAANDSGSVLVAVGAQGSVLRSTDAGRSWSARRPPSADVNLLTVVSAGNRVWIAAGASGQIWRSLDDARTWRVVKSPLAATLRTLSVDATSGRVLLGGDDGVVGFSPDHGESWQVTAIDMPGPVTPVTAIHRFGELLLATSTRGRFLVSSNNADSWDLLQSTSPEDITGAAHHAARGIFILAAGNGDLVRSRDGGRNWEVGEALLDGTRMTLRTIQFDAGTNVFLALAQHGAMARSADGEQWERASRDLRGNPRGVIFDSRGAMIAYGEDGLIATAAGSDAAWTYVPIGRYRRP